MAEIRHVVMMRFKDGTAPDVVQGLIDEYRGLPGKIETMQRFEWGPEGGVSTHTEGFTHCFISTFEKLDDVRAYGPHPAHQTFVERLDPYLERILVFDFEVR